MSRDKKKIKEDLIAAWEKLNGPVDPGSKIEELIENTSKALSESDTEVGRALMEFIKDNTLDKPQIETPSDA